MGKLKGLAAGIFCVRPFFVIRKKLFFWLLLSVPFCMISVPAYGCFCIQVLKKDLAGFSGLCIPKAAGLLFLALSLEALWE